MPIPTNPFGPIVPPPVVNTYDANSSYPSNSVAPGLMVLLNNGLKLAIVISGLYTLINVILAGYQFMSAGGDSKAVGKAVDKIWQSLVGLLLVAGSIILAGIFGWLLFENPTAILYPEIYGPQ